MNIDETQEEQFISNDEVDLEIDVQNDDPVDEEDGIDEEDAETIEVDMSNNSVTYFDKHTDSVFALGKHPTLPLICSGGGDNIAHLWTSHSQPPKFAGSLTGHTESVISCQFTCDGKYLVTADMSGKVLVHVSHKGGAQWTKTSELQEVEEVVWLRTHPTIPTIFAFGATDGSVWCYQIDATGGSLEQLLSGFSHQSDCAAGEFVNADKGEAALELVTCALDGTVVGWNCFTGQVLFKLTAADFKGVEAPWVTISQAPAQLTNGNHGILALGSNNGLLTIINCNSNGAVLHLATVLDLEPGQEDIDASIESISWSNDFPLMALGLVSGDILLYDTSSWRLRHKFKLEDSVTKLQFDGSDLFASCINGKLYQYNYRTGSEKHVCVGHNMGILDFILTTHENGNRRVITAGDEGVSLIFEVPN